MPQTITKTVYTFDELSEQAKETARDWFRTIRYEAWSPNEMESVIEDARHIGAILGITLDTKSFCYDLSGRYGQTVGFSGSYSYAKGAAKAIRDEAPQDTTLHRIADDLHKIQRRDFYSLYARIESSRDPGITCEVSDNRDSYREIADAHDLEETIEDFAHWVYKQLESEEEYRNSDEAIDEDIEANGYTFDTDGRRDG